MNITFLTKRQINKYILLSVIIILTFTIALSFTVNKTTCNFNIYSYEQEIGVCGNTATQESIKADKTSDSFNHDKAPQANLSGYEARVLDLLNTVRVDNGLSALAPDQGLTDISRARSSDLLSRDYFSHYTPEGTNVFDLMKESGIQFSAAGENLAHARPPDIGTPEAFLDAWMNSPEHKANIMQSKFGTIGVGMVENGDRRVVTTVFKN